jgi:predicted P-loop ATPase
VNNKDFYMILEGRLLVEIAEMHSFSVGEIRRVKGIISTRVDRYRSPYASTVEDHPRQAVLACTTNEDDWNRDPTGARRFWPVKCEAIDLAWIAANRDQLFAEAVHVYKTRHIWHDVPPEYATREQDARRQVDAWESAVYDFLTGMDKVTTRMVMERALQLDYPHQTQAALNRVCSIMKVLGWEQRLVRWSSNEQRVRGWVRSQKKKEPVGATKSLPIDDSPSESEE